MAMSLPFNVATFSLTVCGTWNVILLSGIFLLWEGHAVNPKRTTRHSINFDH